MLKKEAEKKKKVAKKRKRIDVRCVVRLNYCAFGHGKTTGKSETDEGENRKWISICIFIL